MPCLEDKIYHTPLRADKNVCVFNYIRTVMGYKLHWDVLQLMDDRDAGGNSLEQDVETMIFDPFGIGGFQRRP